MSELDRHTLRFESDYLVPGISSVGGPGGHRVSVSFSTAHPATGGSMYFDPNACGLDEYGEPGACTKMAALSWQLKLNLLHEKANRRVYAIEAHRHSIPPGGDVPYAGPPLHLVTIAEPGQPMRGRLLLLKGDKTIDRIVDLHLAAAQPVQLPYEQRKDLVVLSADVVGGFVPPGVLLNHVPRTRIYGDGKVVFVDPAVGDHEICEGHLPASEIAGLFEELNGNGFFGFERSYFKQGPTDMATWTISAVRHGEEPKQVSSYAGPVSAPPGFMECFDWLSYPKLSPTGVHRYTRQPISEAELHTGWYYGFEYQKKLNTPKDWVWDDAGRSSRWRRP